MFKHYDTDDNHISLHDCHVTKATYEDGIMTFGFEDGIWILEGHLSNDLNKIVRTDTAYVQFCLETGEAYDVTLYIYEKKFNKTLRKEWDLYKLIEMINEKNHTLEMLYQYKGYNSIIIECCLWSEKKPYSRESELKIAVTGVEYCWNNLREDREW